MFVKYFDYQIIFCRENSFIIPLIKITRQTGYFFHNTYCKFPAFYYNKKSVLKITKEKLLDMY